MSTPKIIAADYHRNGVSGVPFHIAIVEDDGRRMLVVSFNDDDDCYTAAVDLDVAAAGNIYMHPVPGVPGSGGNAWRGDTYAAKYHDAIVKDVDDRFAAMLRTPTAE